MTAKKLGMPRLSTIKVLSAMALHPRLNRLQMFMDLVQQHGPIYQVSLINRNVVVVANQESVHEVCDEARFGKCLSYPLRLARLIAGDGLFTAHTNEESWGIAHRVLMPAFSLGAMQNYFDLMLEVANRLLTKWQQVGPEQDVEVVEDMTRLTFDTIAQCGFGVDFGSFATPQPHPFVAAMNRSMIELQARTARPPLQTKLMVRSQRQLERDTAELYDTVDKVIRERRSQGTSGFGKRDLLTLMLEGIDKLTGRGLSDENIRYQILTFLIAGHETTSGLLSFALYFLIKNPAILAKAQSEVDRVFGEHSQQPPRFSDIAKLGYITRILKETLRLWPTAPGFAVSPHADTTIGGYPVQARDVVMILLASLHRDPAVWGPDAEAFNPDHFLPEAEASRPPDAYKPFGNGLRACIGNQFAMQEAVLVLAMVVHRFTLVDHLNYQLQIKQSLTIKPQHLRLRLKQRRPGTSAPLLKVVHSETAGRVAADPAEKTTHRTALTVLYGSNMGTSEDFARKLGEEGKGHGYQVLVAELDAYRGKLPQTGAVLIVCASYNGRAPDNARAFVDWLAANKDPQAAKGVRFMVFGCGNRDWLATYQKVPQQIEAGLVQAGATALAPRGEGDAREDLGGDFHSWAARVWPRLEQAFGLTASQTAALPRAPLYTVEAADGQPECPIASPFGAQPLRLQANRELQQKPASSRSTRHIEVALAAAATYRVGDHLGILPCNSDELIGRVLQRFHLQGNSMVILRTAGAGKAALPTAQPVSLNTLLGRYVELQDVAGRGELEVLARHSDCPPEKRRLLALAEADAALPGLYAQEVLAKRLTLLDLLERFRSCQLPFPTFLELLAPLRPRYYSISSSPLQAAGSCSITVGVVQGPAWHGDGAFAGVCSTYLAGLRPGDLVHGFVRAASAAFHLPADPSVPVIMIGPGTGLAPFRGFIQERAALRRRGARVGEAWLFYGCRHPDEDRIYGDEIAAAAAAGDLQVHYAYSLFDSDHARREAAQGAATGAPAVAVSGEFVQDKLRQQGAEIWRLLQLGAHVYVCGDASRMEPAVRATLKDEVARRSGGGEVVGEAMLAEMERTGRYAKDVWAQAAREATAVNTAA